MSVHNFTMLRHQGAANPFSSMANGGGKGGGGQSTTAYTQTSNIPEYAEPYVLSMLGAAQKEAFTSDAEGNITGYKPYVPYSANPTDYLAGFTPLQQQAQANIANLQVPGQYGAATGMAGMAGLGGLATAPQAQLYGQNAANIGLQGMGAMGYGLGVGQQALGYSGRQAGAGEALGQQLTSPSEIARYMSPYTQNVVDVQQQNAIRQADIAATKRGASAVASGAFGGARQAIENAEAERNLQTQLQGIQATGQQAAYDKALAAMQGQAQLGLSGLSGAQQGLGTALQGGQLGLAGLGTAMQGQQAGLQGVGAQQTGYGMAGTAAGQLGQLGTQQLAAQQGILQAQQQAGAQQQEYEQNVINQAIQNYATAQQYPQQQLAFMSGLLHGVPMQATTAQSYQAAPSGLSQLAGLGTAAYGMSQLAKKKGGVIKSKRGSSIEDLALYNVTKG